MRRRSKPIELNWPRISQAGYERHSPKTRSYNCIAFAAGDMFAWWEPGGYWPNASSGFMLGDLIAAYQAVGFVICGSDRSVEAGFEKVVLYQDQRGQWTHASRLRTDGWWESKIGEWEDILHRTPEAVENHIYGQAAVLMKRPLTVALKARIDARRRARMHGKW